MAGEEVFIDRLFSVGLSFVPCMMRTFACLDSGLRKGGSAVQSVRVWKGRERERNIVVDFIPLLCVKSNRWTMQSMFDLSSFALT